MCIVAIVHRMTDGEKMVWASEFQRLNALAATGSRSSTYEDSAVDASYAVVTVVRYLRSLVQLVRERFGSDEITAFHNEILGRHPSYGEDVDYDRDI